MSELEESQTKKPRLLAFVPPFPRLGAISANTSSALLDKQHFSRLGVKELVNDVVFFPSKVRETRVVGEKVRRASGKKNISEEVLRNTIYTDLMLNHGIKFPNSSERGRSERQLRSRCNFDLRYKEANLEYLLNELHEELVRKGNADKNARVKDSILSGLNVTTASLPGMTVLRDGNLCFGEFRNSEKHSKEHAIKQCVLYLYALLHFFRVRLGKPVKSVFGFVVCGCGCIDSNDRYGVGFVRLSAPDELGNSLLAEEYTEYYSTSDDTGYQRLVDFLRNGNFVVHGSTTDAVAPSRRIPALLTLPESLWGSPLLVTNGTASMVFKGGVDAILDLLGQFHPKHASVFYIQAFNQSVEKFFDNLADRDSHSSYLKIALSDTTLRDHPTETIDMVEGVAKEYFEKLYYASFSGPNVGVFLMNDCGTVLHESEEFAMLDFDAFLGLYRVFWTETVSVCEFCLHGDALPHNIVYNEDEKKLVLIDYDEGVCGTQAPKREINRDNGLEYHFLRYPNCYRGWNDRIVYTQLQLVASFLQILSLFEGKVGLDLKSHQELCKRAAAADSFLRDHNMQAPNSEGMNKRIDRVITSMEKILPPVGTGP